MKKKMLPLFASLVLLSTVPNAFADSQNPDGATVLTVTAHNLNIEGDLRVRSENAGKTDLVSDRNYTLLRVRPKMTWKPSDTATVILQIQAAKTMGEPVYTPTSPNTNTQQQTSGAASNGDTPVTFHQAYGIYQPVEWFELMAGRQVLSYGNELVIGEADWNNISRSFDAIRMRANYAFGWTDAFTSKIVDTNATGPGPGDRDLHGLYNSFHVGPYLSQFDLYILDLHDSTLDPVTDLIAVGARAQSKMGPLDYRAEWTEESQSTFGNQADAELGYTFDFAFQPRLSIEYFYASSDYNQFFPTAHKWLGYADVLGRRNLEGYAAHFSSGILKWLSVQVDYQKFERVDTTRPAYKLSGTSALSIGSASNSREIGSEVDLTLKLKASPFISFAIGVSQFFAGSYLKDQFGDTNPNFCYAQMEMKF